MKAAGLVFHPARKHSSVIITAGVASLAGLLFGIDTGNIAGALVYIQERFHTTTHQQEIIVSITIFMAFIGAFSSGGLADKFGRRTLLLFSAVLFTIGALLGGSAHSISQLIIARALLGIAIGISSFTAPLYISEISPPKIRGRLILLYGAAITFGEAFAFLIDYFLSFWHAWRIMIWVGILPGILLFIGMLYLPESPRWSQVRSKLDDKPKSNILFNNAVQHLLRLYQSIKKVPKKPLMIGLTFAICQQLSGINAILYYGPILLTQAGFEGHHNAILATFVIGLLNATTTLVALYWVDKLGRRKLMIGGSLIATIALIGFIASQSLDNHQSLISVLWLLIYIFGYCISLGSLFWVIVSEIFPLESRAQMMGLCVGIQWLSNFAIALVCLSAIEAFGFQPVFSVFALTCLFSGLFSYFLLPETNQRSLESIGNDWDSH